MFFEEFSLVLLKMWIVALRHFSTMFGYIWRPVSTAGGTNCSWDWTSNLPLATDNYLSWDSNPSGERRVVSKRDAVTTRLRRSLSFIEPVLVHTDNSDVQDRHYMSSSEGRSSDIHKVEFQHNNRLSFIFHRLLKMQQFRFSYWTRGTSLSYHKCSIA